MLFLLDSIRLARYSRKPHSQEESWLPFVTIGPELPVPGSGGTILKEEDIAADKSLHNVRGIVVSQTAITTIEEGVDISYQPVRVRRESSQLLKM